MLSRIIIYTKEKETREKLGPKHKQQMHHTLSFEKLVGIPRSIKVQLVTLQKSIAFIVHL
jgi:hypothetical protein